MNVFAPLALFSLTAISITGYAAGLEPVSAEELSRTAPGTPLAPQKSDSDANNGTSDAEKAQSNPTMQDQVRTFEKSQNHQLNDATPFEGALDGGGGIAAQLGRDSRNFSEAVLSSGPAAITVFDSGARSGDGSTGGEHR
jgi:hypothetical protein